MLYATDLDRTLIFSKKFKETCGEKVVCVEKKKGEEISYMTARAVRLLNECKAQGVKIVPTTTRSLEQYKRVSIIQDSEYAITTNGGIILRNGKEDAEWTSYIASSIRKTEGFLDIPKRIAQISGCIETELTLVDGVFYYTKVKAGCKERVREFLDTALNKNDWNYTIQGKKVYIIPKVVTKENALTYVERQEGKILDVVSGDGKLDEGMLKKGRLCIIPEGSEVLGYIGEEREYEKVAAGLEGTVEMLEKVKRMGLNEA